MKTLVVYDSYFGNTKKVAEAIAESFEDCEIFKTDEKISAEGYDSIVIGSPTRAFRATKPIMDFVRENAFDGKKVMAFDTRILIEDTDNKFLQSMIRMFGYGAEKIAKAVVKKGGIMVGAPAGFAVKDSEGPLKDGEIERAVEWSGELR